MISGKNEGKIQYEIKIAMIMSIFIFIGTKKTLPMMRFTISIQKNEGVMLMDSRLQSKSHFKYLQKEQNNLICLLLVTHYIRAVGKM